MNFGAFQILILIICAQQTILTEVQEVKPRWIYNDDSRNNTNEDSLPDHIQIDFQFESGKMTLNLIKQSTGSTKPTLMIARSESQSSIWKQSEDELLGTYKDPSNDAAATVTVKKVNGYKETYYMITFICDDKLVFLGPRAIVEDDHFFENTKELLGNKNNKSKHVIVDGIIHSLYETPTATLKQFDKEERRIKRSHHSWLKRLLTVKIFTIFDYQIFEKFFQGSKATSDKERRKDARQTIKYLFTHIMEGVKDSYERIDMKYLKFTTRWIGAIIAEDATDVPFIQKSLINEGSINVKDVLNHMITWRENASEKMIDTNLPNFDFLAMFTSRKLRQPDLYVDGSAHKGGICTTLGVGVIRFENPMATISTTSHELGHSLGVDDDGKNNICNPNDGFIMSYKDGFHNSFYFSNCSLDALERGDYSHGCMENGEDFISGREKTVFHRLYPGQIYDPDDQCKIFNGPESLHSGGREGNDLCLAIKCSGHKSFMALDGTTCSNGAWCQKGKCVRDRRAPRAPGHCPYGDDRDGIILGPITHKLCKDAVKKDPNQCLTNYKRKCCMSCIFNETKSGVCEDSSSECTNLEPRNCYYKYYAKACCKTCQALVQNPSDAHCLYGDKGTNCSDFVPEICHLSTRYCCQTCAVHFNPIKANYSSFLSQAIADIPSTTAPQMVNNNISTASSSAKTTFYASSSNTSFCDNGDFKGLLEHTSIWGKKLLLNCELLVKHNSTLCQNDDVQKYCCASCGSVEIVENQCKGDNGNFTFRSRNVTCSHLVNYIPSLCENPNTKSKCCKSCGHFTIKPFKQN